jgi:hypothetical protein
MPFDFWTILEGGRIRAKDPSIDGEMSKDQFRAEQELRWLRRSQRSTGTSTRDKQ